MKRISIVTPCYNEDANIVKLYQRIKTIRDAYPHYYVEHIVIDNASTDNTAHILKELAKSDVNFKVIFNTRNFGHIRSPYYAMLQAQGDAVISLASDLQDPPEMIAEFIRHWENGSKIVVGVKPTSQEVWIIASLRRLYYKFLAKFAETPVIQNFTGFGLYDRDVMSALQRYQDEYPYFRGLIAELGYEVTTIKFSQPKRQHGKTKNNFYTLYDMAMLGLMTHTRLPMRLAFFIGIAMVFGTSIFVWFSWVFSFILLIAGIQFIFIGLLGEYILAIHRQLFKRPLVIEKERLNFEDVV